MEYIKWRGLSAAQCGAMSFAPEAARRSGKLALLSAAATLSFPMCAASAQTAVTPPVAPPTVTSEAQAAATPDATPPSEEADIIVTAQKRAERALDVPASLTVVGTEDLQRGGAVTNLGLTYAVPGLKMNRFGGTASAPSLRGISSLVPGPGLDPNVATYIDGVYVSGPMVLDLPDAQSVAVLKGPQGTLFGRNATGGAIQITTLKPSFELTGNVSASYGNLNDRLFKGFISVPVIKDKLAISIAGFSENNDGYLRDIISGRRFGKLSAELVRGKILFAPTDRIEIIASAYYINHKDPALLIGTPVNGITKANAQAGAIVPTKPYDIAFNTPSINNSDGYGASLTGVVRTDAGTLTVIGAFDNQKLFVVNNQYQAFAPGGGDISPVTVKDKKQSVEIDFASRQYGKFNYIAGLYFYHNRGGYDPLFDVNDIPVRQTSIYSFLSSTAYAAFGEVNLEVLPGVTATAGIRYSTEKRSVEGVGCACALPVKPALTDFGSTTFNAWTPRFSLRYAVAHNTNVYFTYSQGFKSGGYSASGVVGAVAPLVPFKPEHLTAYEVGIKSAPVSGTTLSASGFYYKYKDQQVSAFVNRNGVQLLATSNAAASTIYGAEFEGSTRLTDEFSLHTGISLLHARFDNYPGAVVQVPNPVVGASGPVGNVTVNRDLSGNSLVQSPDWTVSFGGTYRREFAGGEIALKGDFFRSGKFYFDPGNLYAQQAYNNVDASLAFRLPHSGVTFTVWGKNLTDEARPLASVIGANTSVYFWAPPRTYGVTAALQF